MAHPQAFIDMMTPLAMKASQATGLDPRLIIAQSALETGWGRSAPGNNYFGIKSHGRAGGNTMQTQEVMNGQPVTTQASFRGYADPGASVDDYVNFLQTNPRYGPLLAAQGLDDQVAALGASGYATDPRYADKVGSIARRLPEIQIAQASFGNKVTDADLLRQLEGGAAPTQGVKVTDPEILKALEGAGEAPATPTPEDGMTALHEGEFRAQPGSFWGGMLDSVMNGITFGYGDEIRALDAAMMGETPEGDYFDYSRPFWERYDVALGAEQKQRERFKRDAPVAAGIAEVGGAIATGGGLARQGVTLTGKASSTGGKVAVGAGESGLYGAVYGSGEADRDRRMEGALRGGVAAMATGGAMTLGGIKFMEALTRRGVIRNAPSTEQLRTTASKAADRARAQGVVFNAHSYTDMVNRIERQLASLGLNKQITPKTFAAIKELAGRRGAQLTFDEVETLRRIAGGAAGAKSPQDRMLAAILVDEIDNFVGTPANVAYASGDSAIAAASMTEMRRNWSRMRRAEALEKALTRAERQAGSAGSGGNIDNAMRQQVKSLLNNDKMMRGFSPQERAVMEDVVRGGSMRDALRTLGKIAPGGNGLSLFLNLGGIYMDPKFLAATMIGTGSKALSDRATLQAARYLSAIVRSGGQMPPARQLPGGLTTGAGGYAGQLMGNMLEDTRIPVPTR